MAVCFGFFNFGWPGSTRPSTISGMAVPVSVDAWIKPGHDG
jgi:hypothetical protein